MSFPSSPSSPPSSSNYLTNLGLGYAIAITIGFLVLLSALLLATYICCLSRSSSTSNLQQPISNRPARSNSEGIILPRIIFVAEEDDNPGRDDENAVVGLDQNVINSYPKFVFSKEKMVGSGNTTCSICLCEFNDREMVRMMPECRHYFHVGCIDAWLKLNGSCPVCRNSPLPTPLSTPLQEVVPLSQYAADRRRR